MHNATMLYTDTIVSSSVRMVSVILLHLTGPI